MASLCSLACLLRLRASAAGLTIWRLPGGGFAVGRIPGGLRGGDRMMPVVYTEVDGGRLGDERLPRRVAWGSRRGARSEEISRFPDLGISNRNPSICNQTMSHYLDDDSEMEEEQEEEYEPISSRKGSSGKKRGRSSSDSDGRRGNKKKPSGSAFIDWEVEVDDDVEEDDDEEEDGTKNSFHIL